MNTHYVPNSKIFQGISAQEMNTMLSCLNAYTKSYQKGEAVFCCGTAVSSMGMILSGSVNIEQNDIWGRQTILDNLIAGQVFAETYACLPGELLMVDVVAAETTEVIFLKIERVLKTCPSSCEYHTRLIQNLLSVMAAKNIAFTRKISHITPKSIRERLLSYLSYQAVQQGKYYFEIPFNRQQLADYLCVDRSAMSNELSKMQKEGLLNFHKNTFHLTETVLK